jgi:hypothetical protein
MMPYTERKKDDGCAGWWVASSGLRGDVDWKGHEIWVMGTSIVVFGPFNCPRVQDDVDWTDKRTTPLSTIDDIKK